MSWIQITEADLLTAFPGKKLEKLRAVALGLGQVDPVQPTIDQVTTQIRGFCATHNTLGPIGTIPDSLLSYAVDILAVRIPNRVDQEASDTKLKLYNDAITYLKLVAADKVDLMLPAEPAAEQASSGGSVSLVKSRANRAGSNMDGL